MKTIETRRPRGRRFQTPKKRTRLRRTIRRRTEKDPWDWLRSSRADRLVGTLTDRDIAVRVVAEGRDPDSTAVKDVASTDVVTVDPEQDLDDRKTGEVVERISQ